MLCAAWCSRCTEGATAIVYAATDKQTGRQVALKVGTMQTQESMGCLAAARPYQRHALNRKQVHRYKLFAVNQQTRRRSALTKGVHQVQPRCFALIRLAVESAAVAAATGGAMWQQQGACQRGAARGELPTLANTSAAQMQQQSRLSNRRPAGGLTAG